jgi:tight adherence protein B
MLQPWLIAFFIFAAIFLAVQFVYGYFFQDLKRRRRANERFLNLRDAKAPDRQQQVVRYRAAMAGGRGRDLTRLEKLFLQSGMEARKTLIALIFFGVWIALSVALPVLPWLLTLPAGGVVAALSVFGILFVKRARRVQRFAEQLPDVLDVVVRSLRAGHPLPVSLSLVAREMPAPAGDEFALACDEITYGRDVREALDNLYWRVGYDDLQLFVTSISVAYQTGGNLADILGRLSKMLRERFRMRRKVKSLSAEGRFSAIALSLFPFLMFGIINLIAPVYYGLVWGHPILSMAFGVAAILLVIGNVIMYRMVHFKI